MTDLPAALDIAVFRARHDGSFDAPEALPGWFVDVCPDGRSLQSYPLEDYFPFLETFLVDARVFWAKQEPGQLGSGSWAQPDVHRVDRYFRATAVFHREECLLLLHLLGPVFEDVRQCLQEARQLVLARGPITPRDPGSRIGLPPVVSEVHEPLPQVDDRGRFGDIVGKSAPMRQMYRLIEDLAAVDATVLIEGETGTGKELVAQTLHRRSRRSGGPFVIVNCAGLTESLVASQLFGHRRGAFTGAVRDQMGAFEAAHGGTVLLDEIGDIPPSVQISLLRVLQDKMITRLGDTGPRKVDVRILAATHRSLDDEVAEGRFRADLMYRIRVARIRVPALGDRIQDMPLLVAQFLTEFRTELGKPLGAVSPAVMRTLTDHRWKGNVRELRSVLEFAAIRCRTSMIDTIDLAPDVAAPPPRDDRQLYLDALQRANGKRAEAARLLGVSRATFYRRRAELGITLP